MSPRPATVSVVIPFYGDPEDTLPLVRSLLAEPSEVLTQVVVSDDCSPTPFPLDAVSDPRLTVVRREANGGFGANVNTGLAEVRAPLAFVANSDLEITAAQIEELVRAAAPFQPVVASPQVLNEDGTPQWSGRHFPSVLGHTAEWLTPLARFRGDRRVQHLVGHDYEAGHAESPTSVDWVMGAAMLLPMDQVRAVGGFDEGFHMNSEEVDLQRRLRDRGVASMVFPSIRVRHEGGASSDPLKRRGWLVDSWFAYARKWGRPRALRAGLEAASAVNLAVNSVRQLAGRDVDARARYREETGLIR